MSKVVLFSIFPDSEIDENYSENQIAVIVENIYPPKLIELQEKLKKPWYIKGDSDNDNVMVVVEK